MVGVFGVAAAVAADVAAAFARASVSVLCECVVGIARGLPECVSV